MPSSATSLALAILGPLALVACSSGLAPSQSNDSGTSSADTGVTPVGHGSTDAGHDSAVPRPDATSTLDAPTSEDASEETPSISTADAGSLVINEVNGKGADFVELFNSGATPYDLAGWGVTEAKDEDGGGTTAKTPAVFPAGASLGAGQYAVVFGAPKDGGAPVGACPAAVCLQATWNVSNTNGATVWVLSPATTPAESVAYPSETVASGQSWGRLPNGTGAFALNTATPGKANAAP